jgi:SAM-dependent methyltransferase
MTMSAPQHRPDELLGWMDCLADKARLRLLRLLERHELGVQEICAVMQLPQSTVSRHLKMLSDRGWIDCRRRGTARYYRMRPEGLPRAARPLWDLARGQTEGWPALGQDELRLKRILASREDVDGFFSEKAGRWDAMRAELYGESFLLDAALALLPAGCVVADMGCGTGHLTARLARHAGRVLAVDSSAAMLRAARRRAEGLGNVELFQADLAATPLPSAAADAALLVLVLSYVEGPREVLREAARVLCPGGRAVVVDLLPHDRDDFSRSMAHRRSGFPPEEMMAILEQAGLEGAAVSALAPEPSATGPALFLARAVKGH